MGCSMGLCWRTLTDWISVKQSDKSDESAVLRPSTPAMFERVDEQYTLFACRYWRCRAQIAIKYGRLWVYSVASYVDIV